MFPGPLTGELLGVLSRDSPEVSQITLVTHKHDDNVGIRVVSEFLQPPGDVVVGLVLADVVNEQGTNGATIVGRSNSSVSLLAGSIPDLSLDCLRINLDRAGCELDAYRRLRVEVELITGEPAQEVGLSDTGVTDEHHCDGFMSVQCCTRRRGRIRTWAGGADGARGGPDYP